MPKRGTLLWDFHLVSGLPEVVRRWSGSSWGFPAY
jgi:hypothetical protein